MKRKKVLIDLYSLKHPNCGFGQIALNYARLFADVQRSGREPFDICFLLPNSLRMKRIEIEGVECYYERRALRFWQKSYWQTPKVDLRHSINRHADNIRHRLILSISLPFMTITS